MIVMSHRGYWLQPQEKNSREAFIRSFAMGFGTETDVRDHDGDLVISHDPPTGQPMRLTEFLALVPDPELPLALNIKADGLGSKVLEALRAAGHSKWFVFDMSVPDTVQQLKVGCPVFARRSDWEDRALWHDRCQGIWLDAFAATWYTTEDVNSMLQQWHSVCIVSPELHGRDPVPLWSILAPIADHPGLMICTDVPEKAQSFFERKT